MRRVLVAGGSGALGSRVVAALGARGHSVRVLSRNPKRLTAADGVEVIAGDALLPESLNAAVRDIDVVFSAIGQTVSPDLSIRGPGYMDVDVPANLNLLGAAKAAGARRFVYVSVLRAADFPGVAYLRAHAEAAGRVAASGLQYSILEPTGFFSQIGMMLNLARKGQAVVFGSGGSKSNPIDDGDLAEVCVESIEGSTNGVVQAGGPEILTRTQMFEKAFAILNRPPRMQNAPLAALMAMKWLARLPAPRLADLFEFIHTLSANDFVAPVRGQRTLQDHFRKMS